MYKGIENFIKINKLEKKLDRGSEMLKRLGTLYYRVIDGILITVIFK